MTESSSCIFASLDYLFQKKTSNQEQNSPFDPFSVSDGIDGGKGFVSQTSPNQQPQRKKIFLDYNSTYSLFDSSQLALTIAKLQMEGFEVSFIFKTPEDDIVKKEVFDDLSVKNIDGKKISIFEFTDSFCNNFFSKIDRKESVKQLNLASDESIILSYDQFEKIHDICSKEHWDGELKESTKSHLSYNFLKGSVEPRKLYKKEFDDFVSKNPLPTEENRLTNDFLLTTSSSAFFDEVLSYEDFDVNYGKTFDYIKNLMDKYCFKTILIKNTNTLIALFDKISSPDLVFEGNQKKYEQFEILKILWFAHPNFEEVVSRAKKFEGFEDEMLSEITDSYFLEKISKYFLKENQFPPDFFERLSNTKNTIIFDGLSRLTTPILYQKKSKTLSEQDQAKITLEEQKLWNGKTELYFNFTYGSPQQIKLKTRLNLNEFMKLFANAELNQHFEITERFGDKIIENLKMKNLDELYLRFDNKFWEQFNEGQKKQFLDYIKKEASSLDLEKTIKTPLSLFLFSVFTTLSHFIDLPEAKNAIETILDKEKIPPHSSIESLEYRIAPLKNRFTPEFQQFLFDAHHSKKIDLTKLKLLPNSRIYAKFPKDQAILQESDIYFSHETLRNIYLENFDTFQDKRFITRDFDWDKEKILSHPLKTSPLQITLFNLNQESLNEIKGKIESEEIDTSKIFSVSIFKIQGKEHDTSSNEDEKEKLLDEFTKLFPNLKHLRINEKNKNIVESVIKSLGSEKKITLETYSEIKIEDIERKRKPYEYGIISQKLTQNFSANKTGDKIFIASNGGGKSADQEKTAPEYLMKDSGEIIKRPANLQNYLYIRTSSNEVNQGFKKITDSLFVDSDKSKKIDPIEAISKAEFDATKTQYASSTSEDVTICSFSHNLRKSKKTRLPSISPDNKIVGFYTEPSSSDIEFFKDEESGFYFAQSKTNCSIHYIIEGKELKSKKPTDDLSDLPNNVKKIIDDYVGDKAKFLLSVESHQYKLPKLKNREQYLDDLLNIENKGSCLYRVASLTHKFEKENIKLGRDYRIIDTDGKHILLEVKNKENDWVTLDLGGSSNVLKLDPTSKVQRSESSRIKKCFLACSALPCVLAGILALPLMLVGSFCIPTKKPFQEEEEGRGASATLVLGDGLPPTLPTPSTHPSPRRSPSSEIVASTSLKDAIIKISEPKKIKDLVSFADDFKKFMTTDKSSSLLLSTNRGEEFKNHLLQLSSLPQSPESLDFTAFFASSSNDLAIKKNTLIIAEEEKSADKIDTTIKTSTKFSSFLANANSNPSKTHVLIIDWKKFDSKERVAFNSMFDENNRVINGEKIPKNVKIICIDTAKQKIIDPSISSRFSDFYDLSAISSDQFRVASSQDSSNIKKIEFDGEGFKLWKEKLFGRIVIDGDEMKWQKSNLVQALEAFGQDESATSNLQLNFKNFSFEQQKEIIIFFEQAQALGSVDYHNYKIKIPRDLTIQFAEKEFEFTEVLKSFDSPKTQDTLDSPQSLSITKPTLKIYQDIQASSQLPRDIHLTNSHLFQELLTKQEIDGNQYHEKEGLIESASKSETKTLKLFISENLTKLQFYCLTNQAQKYQVSLELHLAKGVEVPDPILNKFIDISTSSKDADKEDSGAGVFGSWRSSKATQRQKSELASRIIITNNVEESVYSFKLSQQSTRNINLVNIEDLGYEDLFEKRKFHIQQSPESSQHFTFEKVVSQIKDRLQAGEIIILKGEFSSDLLSLLHPQILDLQQNFSNLHFIIEDKSFSSIKQKSDKLSWLDPSLYKVEYFPQIAKQDQEIIRENYPCVASSISADSKTESEQFIKERKDKLAELISFRSALQITGHSGVGKSSLFREIKESGLTQKGDVAVYDELTSFEKWASDTSGKTKILVIDEFNVDGSINFTMFRDLANNPNSSQRIFYKEKFYDLDENHKVVFLGNPRSYGNRYEQKLFLDCAITEWCLQDFPASYIYENILKKPIFEGFSREVKDKISEDEFKEIADRKIKEYKEKNQGQQNADDLPKETVRELQEQVLKEIAKKIEPLAPREVANDNFIATSSNQDNINELRSAIQIRQLQKRGVFPPNCLGTCGVIFEGDSGVGKSVMIEATLEERGIKKIDSLEFLDQKTKSPESEKPYFYYKIPATLSIDQIEKQLIKAFELGVIVVFDEINTRINEGLEKTINYLLTGQHPINKEIKSEPGFMLISGINASSNSGRSNLGPAIESRSNMIFAKPLSDYNAEDFEKIIKNWIDKESEKSGIKRDVDEDLIKEYAQQFKEIASEGFNLRSLKLALPEILEKLEIKYSSETTRRDPHEPITISSPPQQRKTFTI